MTSPDFTTVFPIFRVRLPAYATAGIGIPDARSIALWFQLRSSGTSEPAGPSKAQPSELVPWRLTFAPAGLVRGCWLPGLAAGRCGPSCRSRLMRAARAGDGQLAAVLRANVGLLLRRLRQVHGEGELTLPESSALHQGGDGPPALGDPAKVAQVVLISASPPTGTTLPPPTATPSVPGLADAAS
jgi:hypothetical protein